MSIPSAEARDPRTFSIIGAAMEVHNELGAGFLEMAYQEAFEMELIAKNIPYRREVELPVLYKGKPLRCGYRADFICFDDILVELKAIKLLANIERAQVINYLKATGLPMGLLINFGGGSLEYERLHRPSLSF